MKKLFLIACMISPVYYSLLARLPLLKKTSELTHLPPLLVGQQQYHYEKLLGEPGYSWKYNMAVYKWKLKVLYRVKDHFFHEVCNCGPEGSEQSTYILCRHNYML